MKPLVEINNITLSYSKGFWRHHIVLKNFTLSITSGELVGIIGNNGTGKSTLLKALAGLHPLQQGTITQAPNTTIGYIPEQPNIPPWLTAEQTLVYTAKLANKRYSKESIKTYADMVGLKKNIDKKVSAFSKGMKQRLSFAHMLLMQPKLLLLDEPLSGLDTLWQNNIRQIMQVLKKNGTAVIATGHSKDELDTKVQILLQ